MAVDIDEAMAQRFIREVYVSVLGRKSIAANELEHWTGVLMKSQDPIELFRGFTTCAEKQNNDKLAAASKAMFPNGHFYSPVVNTDEARRDVDLIFRRQAPAEIDLNTAGQLQLLTRLARHFPAAPFPERPDGQFRYYYTGSGYGYGDAVIYWSMLNEFRPSRIIEVGCGLSSILALDTIKLLDLPTGCTFIDPYPERFYRLAGTLEPGHQVIDQPVQRIDLSILDALGHDDILFIDSSHIVKTGSDVHFELTEMLPRLKPGVLIHFHDIPYPFEYGYRWVVEDNYSWNEVYFVQAFLMYNKSFKIEFFNHYLATQLPDAVRDADPVMAERFLKNPGAGLWLRKL